MFISEQIGGAFERWEKKDKIMITAYTGTGKSWFVLYELLGRAIKRNEKILYLVNRRILQKQLREELRNNVSFEMKRRYGNNLLNVESYISIQTYQSIETKIKKSWNTHMLSEYDIVVYDEAHYFYNDSNFNTDTQLSFVFLTNVFNEKIQIFMSATMKKMKDKIYQLNERSTSTSAKNNNLNFQDEGFRDVFNEFCRKEIQSEAHFKEYKVGKNYDYVEMNVFDRIDELRNDIVRSVLERNEKWLIFTDSIEKGEEFRNTLLSNSEGEHESLKDSDVAFISANYQKDPDACASVVHIVESNRAKEKVIISTAVMDNGISFKDLELKNIVIMADNEETFVQMLGRKRREVGQVKLYVCRRDTNYFLHRQNYVDAILKLYERIRESIVKNIKHKECTNVWNYQRELHVVLLDEIMTNIKSYEYLSKITTALNGYLVFNEFAVEKYYDLQMFYEQMIRELQKNVNAFVYAQADWLDIDKETVREYVDKSNKHLLAMYCAEVQKILDVNVDVVMDGEENKKLKVQIREMLVKICEYQFDDEGEAEIHKKTLGNLDKTDRTLSVDVFGYCMKKANLGYVMTKPDGSHYIIQKTM